jgi:hypothetical protein
MHLHGDRSESESPPSTAISLCGRLESCYAYCINKDIYCKIRNRVPRQTDSLAPTFGPTVGPAIYSTPDSTGPWSKPGSRADHTGLIFDGFVLDGREVNRLDDDGNLAGPSWPASPAVRWQWIRRT